MCRQTKCKELEAALKDIDPTIETDLFLAGAEMSDEALESIYNHNSRFSLRAGNFRPQAIEDDRQKYRQ